LQNISYWQKGNTLTETRGEHGEGRKTNHENGERHEIIYHRFHGFSQMDNFSFFVFCQSKSELFIVRKTKERKEMLTGGYLISATAFLRPSADKLAGSH